MAGKKLLTYCTHAREAAPSIKVLKSITSIEKMAKQKDNVHEALIPGGTSERGNIVLKSNLQQTIQNYKLISKIPLKIQ